MKSTGCVTAALIVCSLACISVGAAETVKVIVVTGPTVIAFFPPVTTEELSRDPDTNESLADFQVYAQRARGELHEAGINFQEIHASWFRVKCAAKTQTFRPQKTQVGYYFVAPGKSPHVEYGVMTDTDILQVAKKYFSAILPAQSQIPNQAKPSSSPLDEKLMTTLWFVPRGHCNLEPVESLLQQGASPNARNWDGNTLTALMVAAQNGCADIVKLLLDAGADVNAKASFVSGVQANVLDGITALSSGASSDNSTVVRILVDHGADVRALTSDGATVMLRASTNEIAQIFLDRGLDINAKDEHGYTLLIESAEWEGVHRPSIAFLLAHRADPNAKADDGATALKLATKIGHPDDVDQLLRAGAKE
jgi:ankyrin repeat protein